MGAGRSAGAGVYPLAEDGAKADGGAEDYGGANPRL